MATQQVTILMPVYNGRGFVKEQIDSILNQTHRDLKLVVLDDCSGDGSYEYIKQAFGAEPRVTILQNERNLGVIASFEKLLAYVDTDVFFFADHDDVWLPNKVARTLEVLEQSGADLVYTDVEMVAEDLSRIHPSKWQFSNTPPVAGDDPVPIILKNPVTGCTIAARSSLIPKATPFPTDVPMHDRWLAAVAACTGKVAYVPESTMLYRQHGRNDTGGFPFGVEGFRRRVRKDGRGSMQRYLSNRAGKRRAILAGLAERGYDHPSLLPVARMYHAPWSVRIRQAPGYLAFLSRKQKTLGTRNIVSELFMNLMPYGNGEQK